MSYFTIMTIDDFKKQVIEKWEFRWVAVTFQGRKKIDEKYFKTEKDLAYYLYKNNQL